jgi:hypothetical protein
VAAAAAAAAAAAERNQGCQFQQHSWLQEASRWCQEAWHQQQQQQQEDTRDVNINIRYECKTSGKLCKEQTDVGAVTTTAA